MSSIIPKIIEIKGIDPETAYNEAQAEARHLYGNSRQTGTIADPDGHIIVSGPALLPWDGRRTAQQMLRDGHAKAGGPMFLLRLTDPAKTKTIKVPVDLTGLTPGQADDAIDAAVRQKLPGDQWGIVAIEGRDHTADGPERKGVLKQKAVVTTGKGAKVTKYAVINDQSGQTLNTLPDLASAKAWIKESLEAGAAPMSCYAITEKESGPLLHGENQEQKRTIIAVGTIGLPAAGGNGTYLATGIFNAPGSNGAAPGQAQLAG